MNLVKISPFCCSQPERQIYRKGSTSEQKFGAEDNDGFFSELHLQTSPGDFDRTVQVEE